MQHAQLYIIVMQISIHAYIQVSVFQDQD